MINWKSIKKFSIDSIIVFAMATVGKMIVMLVVGLLGVLLLALARLWGG